MIIDPSPQGSSEWFRARAGVITASMFSEVRKQLKSGPNKGGYTTAAEDYAFRLAVERISGEPLDEGGFETFAMRRGREMEPEARAAHAFAEGVSVEPAGFVRTDDGKFGATADGLIGADGGAEYKCLIDPTRLRRILFDADPSEFLDQCQGGMWITDRTWWHLGIYCPALGMAGRDLTVFRVDRDDDYIEAMERDLIAFDGLVERYRRILAGQEAA